MIRASLNRSCLTTILVLAVLSVIARDAHAQPWLPEKGEATVSVAFQSIFVKDHYFPTGPLDVGHITSNSVMVDVSYAATRRLAVDFGAPFVASKYNGPLPHKLPIDDGRYHGAVQDLRFGLRYKLLSGRLAVTPFVTGVVPSHAYEFYAHSALGQRLRGLAAGTSVGKLLEVVPGAFIQARYSYTFAQRILDISHNKSNADVEVGYFITPSLRVFAIGSGQLTHGGLDNTLDSVLSPTGEVLSRIDLETNEVLFGPEFDLHHDRIDRGHYLNVGGGAAVSLSDAVDLFGSFVKAVAVRNGHAVNRGLTIGISWTVRPKAAPRRELDEARAERSLVRCICQKGKS